MLTFVRCRKWRWGVDFYGGGFFPRLIVSERVGDFAGSPTVLGYIAVTWQGLRRFSI